MFPDFLQPFEAQLKAYALPTITIEALPLAEASATEIKQSKFLGHPYLPIGTPYPRDKKGIPMVLWAQLNFAEMPALEGYPPAGILQFFVSGANWYDMDDYAVRFHKNTDAAAQTDFAFLTASLYEDCPIEGEHMLRFTKEITYGSAEDARFKMDFAGKDYYEFGEDLTEAQASELDDLLGGAGHRIGGYAYFTQSDPRGYGGEREADLLLFQMDTDEEIMFGDSGVANFFISAADLKAERFEEAWFYWDCC